MMISFLLFYRRLSGFHFPLQS